MYNYQRQFDRRNCTLQMSQPKDLQSLMKPGTFQAIGGSFEIPLTRRLLVKIEGCLDHQYFPLERDPNNLPRKGRHRTIVASISTASSTGKSRPRDYHRWSPVRKKSRNASFSPSALASNSCLFPCEKPFPDNPSMPASSAPANSE
jgi:hypothetical protein